MTDTLEGETLNATAAVQTFSTGDDVETTLTNDGGSTFFFRALANPSETTATGTEAELRHLSYSEIKVGEGVILRPVGRPVEYVCGTGNATTIRMTTKLIRNIENG